MNTKKNIIIIIIGAVAVVLIIGFLIWQNSQPGKLDDFAKCLGEKGFKFYGAFWCPHCQSQKTMFGKSQKHLPYIECSASDGKTQLETCKQENIRAYPTWQMPDGSRQEGELTLKELSEKSSCSIP